VEIRRLCDGGWKPVHHDTAFVHPAFSAEEIGAAFSHYWAKVDPGVAVAAHSHAEAELIVVVSGRGRAISGGEASDVETGDVIHVPPGITHTIQAGRAGPLDLFVIKFQPAD
jgi:mannose-6-phosphate isomerase-like protein (cupin superfamily)